MYVSSTCFTARYAETDQMGIIHHSNYPIWFEAGRTDFLKKLGMSYRELEEKCGLLLPLAEMSCSFKKPAKYEDEIMVRTKIKKMSCVRIEFEYEVIECSHNELLAVGSTVHGWTNKNLIPVNIKKTMPKLHETLIKTMD